MDGQAIRAWLEEAARLLAERRDELTALDAAIGDADHGVNMDRGFQAALARITALPAAAPPSAVLRAAGAAVLSNVGGASGPLWGTALRKASQYLGDRSALDGPALAGLLAEAVQAMRALGGASPGDKTMIDALAPAAEALREQVEANADLGTALAAAHAAAEAGARATIPLQARKGRASYLGERSIGHQDPGATSAALIVQALAAVRGRPSASGQSG